ncbi:MAG TPA: DUF4328 domain-containing protein [Pyrinomonadaceae bacterium]|jgi:hypothetical protein
MFDTFKGQPQGQPGTPAPQLSAYRSGHTRAIIAMGLLALGACMDFCSLLVNGLLVAGVLGPEAILGEGGDAVSAPELLQGLIVLLHVPVFIATVVAFLMWLHRAHSNLRPLGAQRLEYTPGWAVGYFFIPFLNLVRPYQAVREVWRWSKPGDEGAGVEGLSFTVATGAPLIGWWWAFWLVSNGLSNLRWRLVDEPGMQQAGAWLGLLDDIASIAAAALAIMLVRTIDQMQTERSRQLALPATTFEQPPPPPNFNPQSLNLG